MIPQTANLIRARMAELRRKYPEANDKELHYQYVSHYRAKLCDICLKILTDPETPSQDTTLRRLRELKEIEKLSKLKMRLI